MIEIDSFLAPERIRLGWQCASKRELFERLGELAGAATGNEPMAVVAALGQREKLGTTGIGDGVAIPHARIGNLPTLIGFFVRLDTPVDYEAVDDLPVDLVFLLLAPEDATGLQLKALARIARLLRDPAMSAKLRGEPEPRRLFGLLGGKRPAEGS